RQRVPERDTHGIRQLLRTLPQHLAALVTEDAAPNMIQADRDDRHGGAFEDLLKAAMNGSKKPVREMCPSAKMHTNSPRRNASPAARSDSTMARGPDEPSMGITPAQRSKCRMPHMRAYAAKITKRINRRWAASNNSQSI